MQPYLLQIRTIIETTLDQIQIWEPVVLTTLLQEVQRDHRKMIILALLEGLEVWEEDEVKSLLFM